MNLCVPLVPPSLNPWQRMSWQEQRRTKVEWYDTVWLLCREQQIPTLERVELDISIYYPDRRLRDWDNGAVGFKLVQDGLVRAGVLPDDNLHHISRPLFPDILYDKKNPRTEVVLVPVSFP